MAKKKLVLLSLGLFLLAVWVPFLSFLIWFAFIPLLLAIHGETSAKSFLIGLLTGAFFFSGLLYWIVQYELRIFVLVIIFTAPFFGMFAWLTQRLWNHFKNDFVQILAPSIAWAAVGVLYWLTPVSIIGDQIAFFQAPFFPAIVRCSGISGITFLILLNNSLLAHWLKTKKNKFLVGNGMMVILLCAGHFVLLDPPKVKPIKVALIQHNLPMASNEWRLSHQKKITWKYEKAVLEFGSDHDLILFPQYGLPFDPLRKPERFDQLAKRKNTSILLGTYIPKIAGGSLTEGARTDSALLFSAKTTVQEYQAVTPPPFRNIKQVKGSDRMPLTLSDGTKIGIMLCYEDSRSEEGRLWVRNGAELLAALSNPGHFLGTPLPRYHLLQDRIRAIETGRYLARVSPNGFSALIDPNGKIMIQSKLHEETVVKGEIYALSGRTIFTNLGPVVPLASAGIGLFLLIGSYHVRKKKASN